MAIVDACTVRVSLGRRREVMTGETGRFHGNSVTEPVARASDTRADW
jgi:hypothetical protein